MNRGDKRRNAKQQGEELQGRIFKTRYRKPVMQCDAEEHAVASVEISSAWMTLPSRFFAQTVAGVNPVLSPGRSGSGSAALYCSSVSVLESKATV